MFLFEEGGEAQLASLRAHANDNAYEVKLQVKWQFLELKMAMKH